MLRAVLPIGAVLVLGLGVYLLVEVRAAPGPAPVVSGQRPSSRRAPEADPPADPSSAAREPAPPAPVASRSAASAASLAPAAPPTDELAGPRLDAMMAEANKAYDRGDFDEAKQLAGRLLARLPTNVRMLRIMVSASCLEGDSAVAQAHYVRLPRTDQEQMKVRCARYGITFVDPP